MKERMHELNRQIMVGMEELRQMKKEDPSLKSGHYENSFGSILNAYREGCLDFDEAIEALGNCDGSMDLTKSKIQRQKISIPVVVTRTGAIYTGGWWCKGGGKEPGSGYDWAFDGLDDEDYRSGYAIVHIDAVIDVDLVFQKHVTEGQINE
jgi:hypothetical protein